MQYAILIYETPEDFAIRKDPARQQEYWAAWPLYTQVMREAGVFVSGAGLQPPETATTLKLGLDKRQVQDGPIADTKEQLGGFYIIDVPDLDAALDWAARCPTGQAPGRKVEVRPLIPPRK